jgi:hypothetical protein
MMAPGARHKARVGAVALSEQQVKTTKQSGRFAAPLAVSTTLWALALVPGSGLDSKLVYTAHVVAFVPLFYVLAKTRGKTRFGGPVVALSLFSVVLLASTLASADSIGLQRWLIGALVMVPLAWVTWRMTDAQRRIVYKQILILGAVQAGLALTQKITGWPIVWGYLGTTPEATHSVNHLWLYETGRSLGTLSHPIPLAFLLGVAMLVALSSDAVKGTVPRLGLVALLAAGIAATGTRSAVLCLAAALVVLAFTRSENNYRAVWRIFAILAAVGVSLAIDLRNLSLITSLDGTGSLTHRQGAADVMVRLLEQPVLPVLFGNGRNSLGDLASNGVLQSRTFAAVDNNFVSLVAVAGILGLAAIVALVVYGWVRGDRTTRAALIFVLGMFFSFDVTLWASSFGLLIFMASRRKPGVLTERSAEPRLDT